MEINNDYQAGYEAAKAGKPYFGWNGPQWIAGWEAYFHQPKPAN